MDAGTQTNSSSFDHMYELIEPKSDDFEIEKLNLIWMDLSYTISDRKWTSANTFPWISFNKERKNILKKQSGILSSGSLVAILGPSGAGKSTLLECLTGRIRKNLTGKLFLYYLIDLLDFDLSNYV